MKYKKIIFSLIVIVLSIVFMSCFYEVNAASRGTRNDVLEGNKGAGITDSSKDKNGNNLKQRMAPSLNGKATTNDLVYLTIPYYGDDGKYHDDGEMVVNINLADEVLLIFEELYKIKYPIHKMVLVDEYNADDWSSINDNNTSAFNYRGKNGEDLKPDLSNLSNHGKGLCIDINPLVNPYVSNYWSGSPDTSHDDKYMYRELDELDKHGWSEMDKKMRIAEDTEIYKIFTSYGWRWLNKTGNDADLQHFDKVDANENNTKQISDDDSTSKKDKKKKKKKDDISIIEVIGGFFRDICEAILSFFDNLHTGREEQGVLFSLGEVGKVGKGKIDIDNFVYYYQGDPEWTGRPFANGTFGPNGCGPTCVAMILTNMTGEKITPNDVINWCGNTYSHERNGVYTGGTDSFTMMEEAVKHFGFSDSIETERRTASIPTAGYIPMSELIERLKGGNTMVLVGLSRGIFTNGGHYVVFAGTYDDGTVIVKDPGGNGLNGRPGVIDEAYNNHHFTEDELSSPNAGMVGYIICTLK